MIEAFRALADHAHGPMAVLDGAGRFRYANGAFAALFSVQTEPAELLDVEWSALLSADAGEELNRRVLPLAKRGGWEGELQHPRGDREPAYVHVRMVPVFMEAELVLSVLVTERRSSHSVAAPTAQGLVPILPIAQRVIVVPVIGTLDANRASVLMRAVLSGISSHRAKAVIIDVTGLSEMDTVVAGHLAKTVLASRLKGARTVVSGVTEDASEVLTDIDADWRGIAIAGELRTALVIALGYVGIGLRIEAKGAAAHDR